MVERGKKREERGWEKMEEVERSWAREREEQEECCKKRAWEKKKEWQRRENQICCQVEEKGEREKENGNEKEKE